MPNINEVCSKIFEIRQTYAERQKLPLEFKELVFSGIYNYLLPIYKGIEEEKCLDKESLKQITKTKRSDYKTQSELLEAMGLEKDIFKKSHWNMYSPDMKARQQVYLPIKLPLNYAEVECDDVYRAMVHYMICHADVHTDTFVDVFGKVGLPAMFCANGYTYRAVWVEDKKLIQLFAEAMLHNRVKVYKRILEIQKQLKRCSFKEQKQIIKETLQYFLIKQLIDTRTAEDEIDKVEFAAGFFFVNCFAPEYWLDSMREIEVNENGEREISRYLDMGKISRNKVKRFLDMKKEEFIYFAEQYKKITFMEVDKMQAVEYLREFSEEQPLHDALLYIDIPKYIREYERFDFDSEKLLKIFGIVKGIL